MPGARRGPGSNQYRDKPARPATAAAAAAAAAKDLRAQADPADPGGGTSHAGAGAGDLPAVSLARFAELAKGVAEEARQQGLRAPSFRSLPITDRRTLRRFGDGTALVSVPARGRRPVEVVDVAQDPEQPGVEPAARPLEVGDAGIGPDERLADRIVGLGEPPESATGLGEPAGIGQPVEGLPSVGIVASGPVYESL